MLGFEELNKVKSSDGTPSLLNLDIQDNPVLIWQSHWVVLVFRQQMDNCCLVDWMGEVLGCLGRRWVLEWPQLEAVEVALIAEAHGRNCRNNKNKSITIAAL